MLLAYAVVEATIVELALTSVEVLTGVNLAGDSVQGLKK